MATALITGGSSGIGLRFAHTLAASGYDLVLIARNPKELKSVAIKLTNQYGVKVRPLECDLSDRDGADQVVRLIPHIKNLEILINNAGFGLHFDILDSSKNTRDAQAQAVNLMALNTMLFSSAAASAMVKRGVGHIINIGSTAAWTFQGNYSAIKSYVVSYTESLAIRLRDTGVTATVVCPAWMHTNFHKSAGLKEPSVPEWLYVTPEEVVEETLTAVSRGKSLIIPTRRWRLIIWLLTHGPVGLRRYITKKYMSSSNYKK